MPVLDGLETTRQLRAGAAGAEASHLPVIAITANTQPSDRDDCLAAGMNDYIAKPFDLNELATALSRWTGYKAADAD